MIGCFYNNEDVLGTLAGGSIVIFINVLHQARPVCKEREEAHYDYA